MTTAPIHLRPSAPVAERVLLPGDPHRALAVAQAVLDEPRMLNHARGLWGYTGTAPDGQPLTVQSTGMGGPERSDRGRGADRPRRATRSSGSAPAVRSPTGFELGQLVFAREVMAADGTSAALGAESAAAT